MILLLQLSIAVIAVFVTYASVYGLGALFATIAVPVMFAGTALEAGKYVAVSYAYQYWNRLRRLEAILLVFFVVLMMAFTSAGVFAYLGQGYQSSFNELEQKELKLAQMESQRKATADRVASIESQIANLPTNSVNGRIKLIREYEDEKKPLVTRLRDMENSILELKNDLGATQIHVGPITYMARAFDTTVPVAATWVIMALTICLDPFALFLSILMNKLMVIRREEAAEHGKLVRPPVPPEPKPTKPSATPTMDVPLPTASPLPAITPDVLPAADIVAEAFSEPAMPPQVVTYVEEHVAEPVPEPEPELPLSSEPVVESEPVSVVSQPVVAAPVPTAQQIAEETAPLLDARMLHHPMRAEINETAGTVVVQRGGQR